MASSLNCCHLSLCPSMSSLFFNVVSTTNEMWFEWCFSKMELWKLQVEGSNNFFFSFVQVVGLTPLSTQGGARDETWCLTSAVDSFHLTWHTTYSFTALFIRCVWFYSVCFFCACFAINGLCICYILFNITLVWAGKMYI